MKCGQVKKERAPLCLVLTRAPVPPIVQKICMSHSLYCWSNKLHVGVDNFVWVHVGQLDGLPDLALQALGPSPGHRELDGLGVPGVYSGCSLDK